MTTKTNQQIAIDNAILTSITQTCCPDVDVDDVAAALDYLAGEHGLTDSVEMRGYTDCYGNNWRLQLFPAE